MAHHPLLEAAGRRRGHGVRERGVRRLAVEGQNAVQPCAGRRGVGLQPLVRGDIRRFVAIQNGGHHFTLAAQGEFKIGQQSSDVRALGAVALAGHRVNRRTAEIRTEHVVAAIQVFEIEAHVHGVGFPREEHDRLFVAHRALHLSELTLLARFNQLEVAQAELILFEHF